MSDYDISVASTRGYASLLKKIDKWTPYVGYAFLRPAQFLLRRPGKVIRSFLAAQVQARVGHQAAQRPS